MVSRLLSRHSLGRFCQKLTRVKTLEENMMETALNRCLSTFDLTMLGIGGMVGSGLYVLTGTVAKDVAGPAVIVSFLFAGFASLLAAFCYAEFGSRVPKTGSAYMFTYVSVGEFWAFLIGWNIILEYMIGGAAVARAWSGYLDAIFSHTIRNFTETHIASWDVPFLAPNPDFLAAGILLLATAFITCGAKVSSWLNHLFAAVSLGVILFILVFGFILADPANYGAAEGGFAPFGFSGIMAGTATCFFAFVGFDVIAASSEEARSPQRSIPIATGISLGLVTVVYTLVSAVLTLMVPWHTLDPDSALADAFYRRGYSWAGFIVAVGSICAMNTVLLSNLFSLPRVAYAMAEDGLLFRVFSRLNPVTKVPVIGIVVFGGLMAVLALVFDLESLVQFLSIGTLLAYTFVAASIIVLRYRGGRSAAPASPAAAASPQPTEGIRVVLRQTPAGGEGAVDQGEEGPWPTQVGLRALLALPGRLCPGRTCDGGGGRDGGLLRLPELRPDLRHKLPSAPPLGLHFVRHILRRWRSPQPAPHLDSRTAGETQHFPGSAGAFDSLSEYLTERVPDVKAKFDDLVEIFHLASNRFPHLLWLRNLAQQGEPAGGQAQGRLCPLRGAAERRAGGDGADGAAGVSGGGRHRGSDWRGGGEIVTREGGPIEVPHFSVCHRLPPPPPLPPVLTSPWLISLV